MERTAKTFQGWNAVAIDPAFFWMVGREFGDCRFLTMC